MHGRVHSSIPHAARRNATRPSLESLEPGRRLTVGGAVAGVSAPTYAGIHDSLVASPGVGRTCAVVAGVRAQYACAALGPLHALCVSQRCMNAEVTFRGGFEPGNGG